jgi:hypothetical protein
MFRVRETFRENAGSNRTDSAIGVTAARKAAGLQLLLVITVAVREAVWFLSPAVLC